MQDVVCLIAPTASGKTALAYELYDTGKYYLISVDSALIYRDMNIGTAKPTQAELQQYPHALVDIINPDQSYSVAQFVKDVRTHIHLAHQQQKIPLLVGGTMMYYMALLDGIADIPKTNPQIRQHVLSMIANQGIENVYQYLQTIDPVLAKRLKPTDSQRIGRAVEVFLQTQKPLSQWQKYAPTALASEPNQRWQVYSILPDRQWLHQRIAQRLDIMWQQGLLIEVLTLQQKYTLNAQMPSMRCVGYRQVWEFLQFAKTYINFTQDTHSPTQIARLLLKTNNFDMINARQTMQNQALYATRQLAKRQYTWLRKLTNFGKSSQQYVLKELTTVEQAKQYLIK